MTKAVTAIASFGVGCALFALVAKIQTDPLSFTSNQTAGLETVAKVDVKPIAPKLHDGSSVSEVAVEPKRTDKSVARHEARHPYTRKHAAHERAVTQSSTERVWSPCSPWRDLGPKLSEIHGEGESRRVRQLC